MTKTRERRISTTKRESGNNPYNANQVIIDPRQTPFLEYLWDAKSETYLDIPASAIKAGYSTTYAENLKGMMPDWLLVSIGKLKRIKRAEKNLDVVLEMNTKHENGQQKADILRIKTDVSKFILERLDRAQYGKDETQQGNTYNFIVIKPEQKQAIAKRIIEMRENQ